MRNEDRIRRVDEAVDRAAAVLQRIAWDQPTDISGLVLSIQFSTDENEALERVRIALLEANSILGSVVLTAGSGADQPREIPIHTSLEFADWLRSAGASLSPGLRGSRLDATLSDKFSRQSQILVWIESFEPNVAELSMWFLTVEGRHIAEFFRGRLEVLFGSANCSSVDWAGQAYASIHMAAVSDGAKGCDRSTVVSNLLRYAAKRSHLWHFGSEAAPALRRWGALSGGRQHRSVALGALGTIGNSPRKKAGILLDDNLFPLTADQVTSIGDCSALLLGCDNVAASSAALASAAVSLSSTVRQLDDPDPLWVSAVLERFAIRVLLVSGPYVQIDFRPKSYRKALGLLAALTTRCIGS